MKDKETLTENPKSAIDEKTEKTIKKNKKTLKIFCIVCAFILTFALGFIANFFVISSPSKTVQWVTDHIVNYGYFFDDEGNKTEITGDQMAKAIADRLLDRYSAYYTEEEYEEVVKGNRGENFGIGVSFLNADTSCKIFKVIFNSPAQRVGLKAGDVIVGAKTEGGGRQDFTLRTEFSEFLKAREKDENFTLYYLSNGTEKNVQICRQEFIESYCEYYDNQKKGEFLSQTGVPTFKQSTSSEMSFLDDDTAYVFLSAFEGNASEEVNKCLEFMKTRGRTKLILDLRNNGGGNLTILQNIASYLISAETENPVIAYAENTKGEFREFRIAGDNAHFGVEKISVIANKNSASASECLIGALRYYSGVDDDKLIIEDNTGSDNKTYGKGIMQTTYLNIKTGSAIKLTTAKMYLPDKVTSIHNVGFIGKPDNCVTSDNCILRAQEVLR